MDAIERVVPAPEVEIIIHGALGRKVFGKRGPLATGAQNIHQPVDDLAHDDSSLAAAALARRDQRLDELPFLVSQITGITQLAPVVTTAIFHRPHQRSLQKSDRLPRITNDFIRFKNSPMGSKSVALLAIGQSAPSCL